MLKGKILRITYKNDGFLVQIEGVNRFYKTKQELDNYLLLILKKSKDPEKLKLLKQDLSHWFYYK